MKETSEFMGVCYHTLYRAIRGGKIRARNRARSGQKPIYGFTAEDIQTYYDAISNPKKRKGYPVIDPKSS